MWYPVAVWVLVGVVVHADPDAEVKIKTMFATSGGRRLESGLDDDVPTVTAVEGSGVTFHCEVEVSSNKQIKLDFIWMHNNDGVDAMDPRFKRVLDTRKNSRYIAKLHVLNLQLKDTGIFSCVISRNNGFKRSILAKSIKLTVTRGLRNQPQLTPFNLTVGPDTRVNLTCHVPGWMTKDKSIDDVKFYHNTQELESSKMTEINSTAVYITVTVRVTSRYSCRLENWWSKTANIYVVNIASTTRDARETSSTTTVTQTVTTAATQTTSTVTKWIKNITTIATPKTTSKTPETTITTLKTTITTPKTTIKTPETAPTTPETIITTHKTTIKTPETATTIPETTITTIKIPETTITTIKTPETTITTHKTTIKTPETATTIPETTITTIKIPETTITTIKTPETTITTTKTTIKTPETTNTTPKTTIKTPETTITTPKTTIKTPETATTIPETTITTLKTTIKTPETTITTPKTTIKIPKATTQIISTTPKTTVKISPSTIKTTQTTISTPNTTIKTTQTTPNTTIKTTQTTPNTTIKTTQTTPNTTIKTTQTTISTPKTTIKTTQAANSTPHTTETTNAGVSATASTTARGGRSTTAKPDTTSPVGHTTNGGNTSTSYTSKYTGHPPSTQPSGGCRSEEGPNGIAWPDTRPDVTCKVACPSEHEGKATRYCSKTFAWSRPNLTGCRNKQLLSIEKQVAAGDTETGINSLSHFVANTTNMVSGDLDLAVTILKVIVKTLENNNASQTTNTTEKQLRTMMGTVDLMFTNKWEAWMELLNENMQGAAAAMRVLERSVVLASGQLERAMLTDSQGEPTNTEHTLGGSSVYVAYGRVRSGPIQFPDVSHMDPGHDVWLPDLGTRSMLTPFKQDVDSNNTEFVEYGGILYRNISGLLTRAREESHPADSSSWVVNSAVLSLSLSPTRKLPKPFSISFKHTRTNLARPVCSYLNYDPPFQVQGRWSSRGCSLRETSATWTVCECDHLTNFAILMSPTRPAGDNGVILSLISLVGCAISTLCLVITFISYIILWRYVKSEPAIMLLNLCAALIISYGLFVFGVDRTDNLVVCTTVAVLLHYFYLVVFSLMLVEGIDVFLSVTTVFKVTSRLFRQLVFGWGAPLLIVGMSVGITQLHGYGNSKFCWLSLDGGLLWAFIGPTLAVIVINMMIVVVVLRAMFREKSIDKKTSFEKARSGLRAICVLLPVMGLTWVFGVFSVNEDLVVFQYLFAICNSLQGLFIFIFHCFTSKQMRIALNTKIRRYQAHKWNSSGSKYFSNSASQRYRKKLTSQRSNTSQKVKLSDAAGELTKLNNNIPDSTGMHYFNYNFKTTHDNNLTPMTPSGGVINAAFTHSPDDKDVHSKKSGLPSTGLKEVKTSSVKSANSVDKRFFKKAKNIAKSAEEGKRKSANLDFSQLSSPVPCQLQQASNRLHHRRAVHDLPRLVLSSSSGQHNYFSPPTTPPPTLEFILPDSACQQNCQSHFCPSPEPLEFVSSDSTGQNRCHSPVNPPAEVPDFIFPDSVGHRRCCSPARPSSPVSAKRCLESGKCWLKDKEKIASDLEQKLKERRKRLDQIYGGNAVAAAKDMHRRHNHLSTLQHIKAKANWKKLKSLLFGPRDSHRHSGGHEWDSMPTLNDLSVHGTFHPFGGIRLPSPQGPRGVLSWDLVPDGMLSHWK